MEIKKVGYQVRKEFTSKTLISYFPNFLISISYLQ